MKKILVILGFLIFLFLGFLFVRFVIGGPEDTWICSEGQWVKHGNPSQVAPEGRCE